MPEKGGYFPAPRGNMPLAQTLIFALQANWGVA